MDVRGIEQKQVFREKNLSLNSVHGRTLFNRLFQKAYGRGSLFLRHLFLQLLTGDKFSPIIPVVLKSFQFCKDVPTGFTGGYSTNTRRKTA